MEFLGAHLPNVNDISDITYFDLTSVITELRKTIRENSCHLELYLNFNNAGNFVDSTIHIHSLQVKILLTEFTDLKEDMHNCFLSIHDANSVNGLGVEEDKVATPKQQKNIQPRKRKTAVSLKEFIFCDEYAISQPRKKNRKKETSHIRAPTFERLCDFPKKIRTELLIYDDQDRNDYNFSYMGRKDDFRLNWPLDQNLCLVEDILSIGPGVNHVIHNDQHVNMPSAEYCDVSTPSGPQEEAMVPTLFSNTVLNHPIDGSIASGPEEEAVVPNLLPNTASYHPIDSPNDHLFPLNELGEVATPSDIQGAVRLNIPKRRINFRDIQKKNIKNLSVKRQNVFRVPFELINPERKNNVARSLTSFLLLRVFKMRKKIRACVPKVHRKINYDKHVDQHVHFIMKKYNLENPHPVESLTEQQSDFLGFDTVPGSQTEDIFGINDPHVSISEERRVGHTSIRGAESANISFNNFQSTSLAAFNFGYSHENNDIQGNYNNIAAWRMSIAQRVDGDAFQITRRKFDLHVYMSDIIKCFYYVGESHSFIYLVGGLVSQAVTRYFLSSLMLANTKNVYLENSIFPDSLQLTLFSRELNLELQEVLMSDGRTQMQEEVSPQPGVSGLRNLELRSSDVNSLVSSPCSLSSETNKRPASDSEEDLSPLRQRGYRKQEPGKGPWKNKSKRGRNN